MTKGLSYLTIVSLLAVGGCSSTDPSTVGLAGTWLATVNALGIATMNLTMTERNSEVTGSGQWIAVEGGASRTVTIQGLHFGVDLNFVLRFATSTGTAEYSTQGRVEDESTFHLVFPVEASPKRVDFVRQ